MQAVTASGRSLQKAVAEYRPVRETFLADERERALAFRVCSRLREWAALGGPGAARAPTPVQLAAIEGAPKGTGTALGSLGSHLTWRQAAAAVEGGRVRYTGLTQAIGCSARESGARRSHCCMPPDGGRRADVRVTRG